MKILEYLNINESLQINDNSFNAQDNNKEKEITKENEFKNPYLKKDDVPIMKIKNKNEMIYDGNKNKINIYLDKINKVNNDFLDVSIYNYCKKC